MEYYKLIISPYGSYNYNGASNIEMDIIGHFLSSDIGCNNIYPYKKWALNDLEEAIGGNLTDLYKENGCIVLTDLYSQEKVPTKFKIPIHQFVQLLDDWKSKVCSTKPKEVIIKQENGQYIIETAN